MGFVFVFFNSVEFLGPVGVQLELREPCTLPEPESYVLRRWCGPPVSQAWRHFNPFQSPVFMLRD